MESSASCLESFAEADVAELYYNLSLIDFPVDHPCSDYLESSGAGMRELVRGAYGLVIFNMAIGVPLFYFTIRKLAATCRKNESCSEVNPALYFLALLSLLDVIGWVPALFAFTLDWKETDLTVCSTLWKMGSFNYVLASLCSYNIMYLRAGAVLKSKVFAKHIFIRRLCKICQYATWIGIPTFLVLTIIYMEGRIYITGFCGVFFPTWLTMTFVASDTLLSLLFLIVFLYPVYVTLSFDRSSNDNISNSAKRVARIAKRNLILSSIAIAVVLVALGIGSYASLYIGGPPTVENAPRQFFAALFTLAFAVDRIVISVVHFMITSVWWPEWMYVCFKSIDETGTGTSTGIRNDPQLRQLEDGTMPEDQQPSYTSGLDKLRTSASGFDKLQPSITTSVDKLQQSVSGVEQAGDNYDKFQVSLSELEDATR